MRVLLDTHVFLWLTHDPDRVGPELTTLADPRTELLLSAASAWEIAIKYGLGRLELPEPPRSWLPSRVRDIGAVPVPVDQAVASAVAELPHVHRDPFDRLLVAKAKLLGVRLATADRVFARYDVDRLQVGS